MTRSIDSIKHDANQYVKITINCADGDGDVKVAANPARATVTAQYKYTPNEALMATECVSANDDRGEAHAAIRDALAGLDVDDNVPPDDRPTGTSRHWMDDGTPCCQTISRAWTCTATTRRSAAGRTCTSLKTTAPRIAGKYCS